MRCTILPQPNRRERWLVTNPQSLIRIGTRGSALALRQTELVAEALRAAWPDVQIVTQIITTIGDQITTIPLPEMARSSGGEGVFTSGLEKALLRGEIDLAVHSLKDLPTQPTSGTTLGAVLERGNPADVLISRAGDTVAQLPTGAVVGTSSRRRAAQLLHQRPDLKIIDIRGNIDTRINKALAPDGDYDAILLAAAGLERLNRLSVASEILPLEVMLPAPGQAALAVQCRDEDQWRDLLSPINHAATYAAVTAERAFLRGLGGGCAMPVAAFGIIENGDLHLRGRVIALDGSRQMDVSGIYPISDNSISAAEGTGLALAQTSINQGALEVL